MNIFNQELQESDLWLLRAAGALLVILLGSIIYRSNVFRIGRKKALVQAAAKFRNAIDITRLENLNSVWGRTKEI